MGFMSWLTGRDEKESDVYANFERVDDLVTNLKKVSTDNVTTASDAVKAAVTELNNVKGMAEYVGQVNADCFTPTFERVTATIDQVGAMIQQKADNIKAYEESTWYEKLGSTFAMAGAKLGEGLLSVVEDLGDGVVSLVGWVAPADSGVEQWCSEFVQKEWAHDTFNFYYESELAKASAFTEDSAIAGACKIVGATAGYLFAGGMVSGAGSAIAGGVTKAASGAGKLAKVASVASKGIGAASKVASATTWGATAVAGLAGMGAGTESALLNGAGSFDEAAWSGAKQGTLNAALAFAGGKLGEKMTKSAAVKGATQQADEAATALKGATDAAQQADDVLKAAIQNSDDVAIKAARTAAQQADDALQVAIQNGDDVAITAAKAAATQADDALTAAIQSTDDAAITAAKAAATQADDALVAAKSAATQADDALAAVKDAKVSSFEGYNDRITQSGQKVGYNATNNVIENGIVKGTVQNVQGVYQAGKTAVGNAVSSVGNAGKTAVNAVTHPVQTLTSAANSVKTAVPNAIKSIPSAIKAAPTAALNTAKAVGTAVVANPGVVAQGVNAAMGASGGNADVMAVEAMGPTTEEVVGGYVNPTGGDVQLRVDDTTTQTPTDTGGSTGGGSTGGYTGGSTGGGSTGGSTGGDTGGSTGGGSTGGSTGGDTGGSTGGYTGGSTGGDTGGYTGPEDTTGDATHTGSGFGEDEFSGTPFDIDSEFTTDGDEFDSLADIIANGDKLTEIPSSSTPIKADNGGGTSAVIPIAAGLSAAAAAGIGAKVYMDRKNNSENGEDDEFDTDDWSEDGQIEIDYDESEGSIADQYLKDEDDYGYQADTGERYGARTSEELADLQ